MNNSELQYFKERFHVKDVEKNRRELYSLRRQFVSKFTPDKIRRMKLDEYVEGKRNTDTFCYWVERKLDKLGSIRGAFATIFSIFYKDEIQDYWFAQKFGESTSEAFWAIKEEILSLLDAGKNHRYTDIVNNRLSPMFKGKILSLYYPNDYLNIFSKEHLIHYLKVFNLDTVGLLEMDSIYLRKALIDFKNRDPEMRGWDLDLFGVFLYTYFPPAPKGEEDEFDFPTTDQYSIIDLDLSTDMIQSSTLSHHENPAKKVDYEKEAKRNKRMGDRGEFIVLKAEEDRLACELGKNKAQIDSLLRHIAKDGDSFGYDIRSINDDGSPRYIEVKATAGKPGDVSFFYTENEYRTAQKFKDKYYIYIVFEIRSAKPKIWRIQNPFLTDAVEMAPIQYRVSLRTGK